MNPEGVKLGQTLHRFGCGSWRLELLNFEIRYKCFSNLTSLTSY
jgi:hypothetical protein